MTTNDCLAILRSIKDAAFATVDENGRPQVRIIDVMLVEDEKLYFCTARGKDFYRQLINSGAVAVTALNKDFKTVRVAGSVKKLDDQKYWIDRIFEENPVMNDVYPSDTRYILEPFCIYEAQVEMFDLGTSPIYRESHSMGGCAVKEAGFEITDSCIACGTCKSVCPQGCINEGDIYSISGEHCLHCGNCFENCPVEAIIRK